MLRQSVSLYFHESTFYADEFKDYFTTLHGLIYDHMLGEWYESKDMRSYVMLFPLLPFVTLYKWLQIENIYILETNEYFKSVNKFLFWKGVVFFNSNYPKIHLDKHAWIYWNIIINYS